MIAVRPATPADVPAMSAVLIASITMLCGADHHDDPAAIAAWTANKTPEGVAAMLAAPGTTMLVAMRDDRVAAVGSLVGRDEIGLNYVDPACRFTGLSRALVAALEARMRDAGTTIGRLKSTITAHPFYLSAGWIDSGPLYRGRFIEAYPMTKQLL